MPVGAIVASRMENRLTLRYCLRLDIIYRQYRSYRGAIGFHAARDYAAHVFVYRGLQRSKIVLI